MVLQVAVAIQVNAAVKGHRVLHDVAVVGYHVKGHTLVAAIGVLLDQCHDHKTRHVAVQYAKPVPASPHLHVGLVQPVDHHAITEEAVRVEQVEPQLALPAVRAVLAPGLAGNQQVDVVVTVAPLELRAAGKPQVYAVVYGFVAAIETAVVVHHRGVALVNILGSVIEHVIVEPVRAHDLAPVAGNIDVTLGWTGKLALLTLHAYHHDLALLTGSRRPRVGRIGVDGVMTGEHHRPVVIVELARQEERRRVPIALSGIVTVVLMGADKVAAESTVGIVGNRQHVVVAEQYRLPVPGHHQLGGQRTVKGPQGFRVLHGHIGMKTYVEALHAAVVALGGVVEYASIIQSLVSPLGVVVVAVHLRVVSQSAVDT